MEKQVAALPWRMAKAGHYEVLLITSRETKRWVIPKGWPMEHLKDPNAAKQEAFEEAGVRGVIRRRPLGTFTYDKRKKDGSLLPVTVTVYGLRVVTLTPTWPERTQRQRKWFNLAEGAEAVLEPGLKQLIGNFVPVPYVGDDLL
jgi:8-oxo-dGTP pyrophosphatase MutT (NUDIX family)